MPESKLTAHIDAELATSQVEELAKLLAIKRDELEDRIDRFEQQMLTRDDCSHADAADAASAQEGRLRAGALVDQLRQTLNEIDAAFRRLEAGSYGVSEKTGEPISFGRLKLVPWARASTDDSESIS